MGSEALTFRKAVPKGTVVEVDLAILVAPRRDGVLCTAIREGVAQRNGPTYWQLWHWHDHFGFEKPKTKTP